MGTRAERRAAWLAATILASAACAGQAGAAPARHVRFDPRDARINALEQQVKALADVVAELKAERTAPPPATATAATPAAASGTSALASSSPDSGSPPATSPDQPRPVTSSGPGPNGGGVTILAGRPSIQSGDGRFVANLHGVMQFDADGFIQRAAGPVATDFRRGGAAGDSAHARDLNNGTFFRRARIGIDGKVFGDFDYNVLFEFGGAGQEDAGHIQELWLQYTGLKPFRFRVGAFPPSIGLEDQGSTNGSLFLERPAISDIARGVAGGDFREGAQLAASRDRWFASVALTTRVVGVTNSSTLGAAQPYDQAFGGIVRAAVVPIQGDDYMMLAGVHGSRVFSVSDAGGPDAVLASRYPFQLRERPELRIDGTRLIDSGQINSKHVTSVGAEMAAQKQQFFIQGEYEHIGIDRLASPLADPHFHGWYVEGGWVLTGERRKFNTGTFAVDAPTVDHPFDIANGTFGAFELAARYSLADLNYRAGDAGVAPAADAVRGGEQRIVAAGLNWYLNPVIRFMFQYQHVKIDRLSPNATSYMTPAGAQIGQSYDSIAVRSQLAF